MPQTRADILRRLGRDPTDPRKGPGTPLPIPQVPAFNTQYGYTRMPQFTGPFAVDPTKPAPQVPAPTQGLIVPGTITNLWNRFPIPDPYQQPTDTEGRISNTISMSTRATRGPYKGLEVLVPTVVNGKFLSDNDAMEHFYRTGEHLGVFDNGANADRYATWLHNEQTRRMASPP